jgi:PAS domain S-box-containing protein
LSYNSTILVVDDQESGRQVLSGLLGGKGYHLVTVSSGPEALIKAAELVPDLILLDVMMPEMDGFEVCRRLRVDPHLAEVPVIMLTALDDRDSRLQGIEAGADDFITKPFNRVELETRVRTITRLNRQRRLRALELQAQNDRTQAILQAVGEAVVVADAEGIIRYLNPAAVSLTGFTPEEALNQSWRLWQSEETDSALYDEVLETVRAGQTWRGEVVNKRKDGLVYDAALTVAPLYMPGLAGQFAGFVSVQRDITPLKKAEQAKNEFVSNVSHELRTPLSVLTLVSDNLDTFYERLGEERRRKMIRDIQKHTQILNDLIVDILEISRIDSGRVSVEHEPVDLVALLQAEVEEISPLAQQKMQLLQVVPAEPLEVSVNKAQMRHVIRNLLDNAIKYTPEGGQIRCECLKISLASWESSQEQELAWPESSNLVAGAWAALRVADNGIGISAEHLPHLFDRFYRVNSQQTIRGTGLGLALARKLVELHGGEIAVASSPGQGSAFAIYLPLVAQD